jgi:hypothetical protein
MLGVLRLHSFLSDHFALQNTGKPLANLVVRMDLEIRAPTVEAIGMGRRVGKVVIVVRTLATGGRNPAKESASLSALV